MTGARGPNLTLMFGLRWEYFSPYSEKNGRLVNLNVTGSGRRSQIANVCAHRQPTGCQQVVSSGTLVNPDKTMYSPRDRHCLAAEVQVYEEHGGAHRLWHQLQHRAVRDVCAQAGVPAAVRDHADEHTGLGCKSEYRVHACEPYADERV